MNEIMYTKKWERNLHTLECITCMIGGGVHEIWTLYYEEKMVPVSPDMFNTMDWIEVD